MSSFPPQLKPRVPLSPGASPALLLLQLQLLGGQSCTLLHHLVGHLGGEGRQMGIDSSIRLTPGSWSSGLRSLLPHTPIPFLRRNLTPSEV